MTKLTLKAWRVNTGLTQQEVAEILGITRSTVQSWERYKTSPDADQALKLSELYGCKLDNILFTLASR